MSPIRYSEGLTGFFRKGVIFFYFWILLEGALRNPMELLAVQRIVLRGDKPREVARDLGLPLHQIRVHKSRALQRLRADPIFMDAYEQLAIDLDGSSAAKEQTDERS